MKLDFEGICNQRVGSSSLSTGTTGNKALGAPKSVHPGRFFIRGNVRGNDGPKK